MYIITPLTDVVNKCLEEGLFPEQLKISKIVPIYKKGELEDPSSCRHISILPVFSKIFEGLLKGRSKEL